MKATTTKAPSNKAASSHPFDLDELLQLATQADAILTAQRDELLLPSKSKQAPRYSSSQLAEMLNINSRHLRYLVSKQGNEGESNLPIGTHNINGQRRMFSLEEARTWIQTYGPYEARPQGQRAACIAVVNFKGGSTKTTTAFNVAQGLTLRGRKVLLVDLDPQGSATTLTAHHPSLEIAPEETIGVAINNFSEFTPEDVMHLPKKTYWDGLDIIPSNPSLFNAELYIPQLMGSVNWWSIINDVLEPLREQYDVIVFDTPPSLSYLTLNAIVASDGLIMPIPTENLDYASSVAFWALLTETFGNLKELGYEKNFSFLSVLPARVEANNVSSNLMRNWITMTYGKYIAPVEIPKSTVNSNASANYKTVYDIERYEGSAKTLYRLRDAWEIYVNFIDENICTKFWGLPSNIVKTKTKNKE